MPKEKRGKEEWVRIRIYLSEAEKKIIKRQARERGLSVNAYIRSLIREYGKGNPSRILMVKKKGRSGDGID